MAAERSSDPLYVLAPTGRDGGVIVSMVRGAGIPAELLASLAGQADALADGAGLILAQEALDPGNSQALNVWLGGQPPWSDYPIIFLRTRGAPVTTAAQRAIEQLGNVTILERPLHPTTLISA